MQLSLRTRLMLGNTLSLAGFLAIFAISIRMVTGHVLQTALDETLKDQARARVRTYLSLSTTPSVSIALPPKITAKTTEQLANPRKIKQQIQIMTTENFASSQIFSNIDSPLVVPMIANSNVSLFANNPETKALLPELKKQDTVFRDEIGKKGEPQEGEPIRACYQAIRVPNGPVIGVMRLTGRRAPLTEALRGLDRSVLLLSPCMILLSLLGGVLLTRSALKPIQKLTEAVEQMEATRLSERLPNPIGNDEFARLTIQMNRMLARLENAFLRQKRFIADASHELRTPLAAAKATTDWLQETAKLTPAQQEAMTDMETALSRSNRLISDLLLLARTEASNAANALPSRPQSVQLAPLLASAVREIERATPLPHAKIHLPDRAGISLATDPDLLTRIVLNLLQNALRHTPPKGSIHLLVGNTAQDISITIRDTGEGIASETLKRLGEPFYRPDNARSRDSGGAGLGLALCYQLAQVLGGKLILESTLGEGTTVTLTLPLDKTT
jgi:two-component system, OmpR family, sensor kinase